MKKLRDQRIVMTLDAGGTKLAFSAMQAGNTMVEPFEFETPSDNLEEILNAINLGFHQVHEQLASPPAAICSAFPGPAEFGLGIIGDLENLPAFHGGVALGAMLEDEFGIPAYIANDGDLFTYGEALGGLLPQINQLLEETGSLKRYRNLLGVTLGTGFGGGIVHQGSLFIGDNWAAAEINRMRNFLLPDSSVEESVSVGGVRRVFAREAGISLDEAPSPKEIYEIGMGFTQGPKQAAVKAYEELAVVAGDALANAATLVDGLIVLGGGLAQAHALFLPKLVAQMNKAFKKADGSPLKRMESKVFDLVEPGDLAEFLTGETSTITSPFSGRKITYDPMKRLGVGVTRLGTTRAAALGAYAWALDRLDAAMA